MGTRNLTIVVLDKQIRVAQYAQWDGYPSGQGATACEFIQSRLMSPIKFERFKNAVRETSQIPKAKRKQYWIDCGAEPDNDMVSMVIADKHKKKHPELSRDTGADILELIYKGAREIDLQIDFVSDSLFCEFAYVLDLDTKTLEVYKGFNEKPLKKGERFFDFDKKYDAHGGDSYFAVKHWASFAFEKATPEEMQKLEKTYDSEESA